MATPLEKTHSQLNEKEADSFTKGDVESSHGSETDLSETNEVLSNARDLVTHVISLDDDPTLNPWTFRVLVIGLGLSAFGGVLGQSGSRLELQLILISDLFLAEIYYFKPQTVLVSTMFLAIITYILGKFMETVIPTFGAFRYLNPVGTFTQGSHGALPLT